MWGVLAAALLFGAAFPLCRALAGDWGAVPLAGALYLASGLGLSAARTVVRRGEPVRGGDWKWLWGAVLFGGMAAPIAFVYGSALTTGYAGALLGNLETVFTAVIAVAVFRERLGAREWAAFAVLLAGAATVGWATAEARSAARPVLGGVLVAVAGLLWAVDNNFTRRIADRDPLQIAGIKGLVAGPVNLALGLALKQAVPLRAGPLIGAALVGLICYGVSLVLTVIGMRRLGAARVSALYTTSPVSGVIVSWLLLREAPGPWALAGGAAMVCGVLWLAAMEASKATPSSSSGAPSGPDRT